MRESKGAGQLRERLHFQARGTSNDGFGNTHSGDFQTVFSASGNLRPLRGNESVMAARLEGRQPFVLTVRQSAAARQVNEAWQVVDARDGRVFAITAPPVDPDGKNRWLEMLVVQNGRS